MATTIDTRTAITFTLPDDAVTIAGNGGGASVDLSSATALGGLLAENDLDDVASAATARANLGAVDLALSEAAGVSVALGDFADDAAAAIGGVAVGALYRNGSILMVRVA